MLELVSNGASGGAVCADAAVASSDAQTAAGFFSSYYISLLQDTFYVLSDTDHRAAFKNQVGHVGSHARSVLVRGLRAAMSSPLSRETS